MVCRTPLNLISSLVLLRKAKSSNYFPKLLIGNYIFVRGAGAGFKQIEHFLV